MTTRHATRRRVHSLAQRLRRFIRFKLLIPVLRSRQSPEFTARGVANGVFWGLTPTLGLQTIEILGTWGIARFAFGRDSSLIQALIWVWVNNPITMVPMFYVFYLTGVKMMGGPAGDYNAFVRLWDETETRGWLEGLLTIARGIGLPMLIGCVPYAIAGSWLSYRWALKIVRARRRHFE